MVIISLLKNLAWLMSFICTIYASYYIFIMIFSFKKSKPWQIYKPKTRFLAVIAARNEEAVIGNLVESLLAQNYPRELFDVLVIPNNCTDKTRDVALTSGAKVLDILSPVKSKGQVLNAAFEILLLENQYDAFSVFDADNLVDPNFLQAMNNAVCAGANTAQGYRDSKNPHDTAISACCSITYWIFNIYNKAHSNLGLSATISGTGFMITAEWLRKCGGWQTTSLLEDIEFTQQTILAGGKISWVREAITYDEHPLTLADSWKQRKRWAIGQRQVFKKNWLKLLKPTIRSQRLICIDQFFYISSLYMTLVYCASALVNFILNLLYIKLDLFPETTVYYRLFLSLDISYLASIVTVLLVIMLEKKFNWKLIKGIAVYWFFLATWIPIILISLFSKNTEWEQIKHTRVIKLKDIT
jgi:cellulose synthase/poly-beta-1,6-N-acetylglucosamine synthase-like glycosyltransferase